MLAGKLQLLVCFPSAQLQLHSVQLMGHFSSQEMDSPLKYTRKVLGRGKYGAVFEGSLHRKPVAVKRVLRTHLEHGKREEAIMAELNHQNIIKLLFTEDTEEFR